VSPAKPAAASAPSIKSEPEAPSLERELSLLERARTRLSEGQPQSTLQLLREHRLSYPRSALQQEREALTIRALMAAGRVAEARDRAARFVQAYPTSALRGSVERAVESIP
jgi:outer membrane protein assembly factor BamD (BamD/ComL family)